MRSSAWNAALVIAGLAQEVAGALGMKAEGAEALLGELEKEGAITDVGFKYDKTRKYTKAKT